MLKLWGEKLTIAATVSHAWALWNQQCAVVGQVNAPPGIEGDTLGFQQCPLCPAGAKMLVKGNPSPDVDHPVPGHVAVSGQSMEGVTDQAGLPRQTGRQRYPAIVGDSTGRDRPHSIVDGRIQR